VPTLAAGRVSSLAVGPGSRVSQGTLILTLEIDGDVEPPKPFTAVAPANPPRGPKAVPQPEAAPVRMNEPASTHTIVQLDPTPRAASQRQMRAQTATDRIYASPSLRRLGRELGADLAKVTGSGRGGRILPEDLYNSVRRELQASSKSGAAFAERSAPKVDFSLFGPIERQPLARIRRISGSRLARNWAAIPHVTNFDEADVTDLDAFRVKLNQASGGDPKLTLLPFVVKAIAATLRFAPAFNASLDGDELILKKYVNVGVAVDTVDGLVVPVIRGVDQLGIIDIARKLSSKAAAARAGKLETHDMEGGCFTISSLGGVGGTGFTPIINAPEIAILGVAKATIKPCYDGTQFLPRLILPLSLSWDHRATDGLAAARFLVHLVTLLQDFRRISL
jgi:pyruvate dehydrogenase E2 component (dihydrolipoamide acetyltransferase)